MGLLTWIRRRLACRHDREKFGVAPAVDKVFTDEDRQQWRERLATSGPPDSVQKGEEDSPTG